MNDLPIAAREIDRWADWIEVLEPEYVPNARRRFALTHGLLERAAIASKHAADREAEPAADVVARSAAMTQRSVTALEAEIRELNSTVRDRLRVPPRANQRRAAPYLQVNERWHKVESRLGSLESHLRPRARVAPQ